MSLANRFQNMLQQNSKRKGTVIIVEQNGNVEWRLSEAHITPF